MLRRNVNLIKINNHGCFEGEKLKKKDIRVTLVEGSFEEPLSYENFRIHVYQCFGFD